MTELQQELLNELEKLENSRNSERLEYEQSLKTLSEQMAKQYSDSLTDIMNSEDTEGDSLIAYLQTLTKQNSQIIELLKKPPTGDSFKDALDDALEAFSQNLMNALKQSNLQLVEEIKNSLEEF